VKLNDPTLVASQYASEAPLEARRSVYSDVEGPDAREVAFAAIAEAQPRRVLEVGGGPGELSERIARELRAEVVMVDISPRMVELARGRGVDARVGDVQALPFGDADFDCVVAAWMLYHVPDLDRGLAELRRVVRPGGRLVAVTNGREHKEVVRRLAGRWAWQRRFLREEALEELERHFSQVERRDVDAWATIDPEGVQRWIESLGTEPGSPLAQIVEEPVRARIACAILVAEP
jgi:ubiquinone/menaquinone biosynthesis C-methylase UbiE